ncbi:hypothetical protein [Bradyrhizobium sp. HKCCYLR20261]|uniref:hypothetical protein n=1 Tax=Bradyrhizobium sp. HKCCYLR20261 TaxID=3420760 RepID=UPI003EBA3F0F
MTIEELVIPNHFGNESLRHQWRLSHIATATQFDRRFHSHTQERPVDLLDVEPAMRDGPNYRSPNRKFRATLTKSRQRASLCLDIKVTMVMFAQPLGSQLAVMRNFIAILLIVVVPRRIAGDG